MSLSVSNQNEMLISMQEVADILTKFGIKIHGVLHVGMHEAEELKSYQIIGVAPSNVVWIEALEDKVQECRQRLIPNVHQLVASDADNHIVTFHRTNNVQSSSMLDLGTHLQHHPHVHVVSSFQLSTTKLDTFLSKSVYDASKLNFWNLDIQGAELKALKGGISNLHHVKAIYTEVNTEEVYKGCALLPDVDHFLGLFGFIRVLTKMTEFNWGDALYIKI